MRLIYMGTPEIAVPALRLLSAEGLEIAAVVTQPDRPAGRHNTLTPPPVKTAALDLGLAVLQPESTRDPAFAEQLAALRPEVIVVFAFGEILRKAVLEAAPLGCVNVHPSLLPKLRGPSPVAWAILEGHEVTGVSIMLLEKGVDAGPILAQEPEPVLPTDTTETLSARLAERAGPILLQALKGYAAGAIQPVPQQPELATFSRMLRREDGLIDWTLPAEQIDRRIRAFTPWPGTYTTWQGQQLKVLEGSPLPNEPAPAEPGSILRQAAGRGNQPLLVAAGQGALAITRVQLAGKKAVTAGEFVRGQPGVIGAKLG